MFSQTHDYFLPFQKPTLFLSFQNSNFSFHFFQEKFHTQTVQLTHAVNQTLKQITAAAVPVAIHQEFKMQHVHHNQNPHRHREHKSYHHTKPITVIIMQVHQMNE